MARVAATYATATSAARADASRLLRRWLMLSIFSGAIGGMNILAVFAQVKMPPGEAAYQDGPRNGLSCAACSLFRPPRSCEVVAGDISPRGWCKFFDLPD